MHFLPGKAVKCKLFTREMAYCGAKVHLPSPSRADTDYTLLAEPQAALGKAVNLIQIIFIFIRKKIRYLERKSAFWSNKLQVPVLLAKAIYVVAWKMAYNRFESLLNVCIIKLLIWELIALTVYYVKLYYTCRAYLLPDTNKDDFSWHHPLIPCTYCH